VYSVSNNHFTVRATGADIWGSADELHFVHAPVRGDHGSISARVAVLSAEDDFAKSGVMLRESLAPDAATVIFDVRPNGELEFMVRAATGEEMSFIGGTRLVPIWLQLQRDGSQVIAQTSPNGITWTLLATVDIALPDVIYAGPAVTSRDPASAATTLIDGFTGWWSGVP
jgi:hypothetical protein